MQHNKDSYNCSYITNIQWLTAAITLLSFAPTGDFMLEISHTHPFMELHYVQSGKARVHVLDQDLILEEGQLLFINTRVPHYVVRVDGDAPNIYNISFLLTSQEPTEKVPAEWIEDERMLIRLFFQNKYLVAHDNSGCGKELTDILNAIDSHRRGEFVRVRSHISNLIMGALQSFAKIAPNPRYPETITGSLSYKATQIMFYLRDHFAEGLSLSSVSQALHYSPRQCQRIIQDSMGISFSELLQELQLSYAKTLLFSTEDSLEEISTAAGFNSSRSFYRFFKMQEGISPSQYRKIFSKKDGS